MRFERLNWSTGRTVFDWPLEFSLNIYIFFLLEGSRLCSASTSNPELIPLLPLLAKKAAAVSGAHRVGPPRASARSLATVRYARTQAREFISISDGRGWFRRLRGLHAWFRRSVPRRGVSHFAGTGIAVCCGHRPKLRWRGAQLQTPQLARPPPSRGVTSDILIDPTWGRGVKRRRGSKLRINFQTEARKFPSLEYKNWWFSEGIRRHRPRPAKCSKGVSHTQLYYADNIFFYRYYYCHVKCYIIFIQVPSDPFWSGASFLRITQNPTSSWRLWNDIFFLSIKNRGRRVQVAPRRRANVLSEDAAPLEAHL